MSLADYLAKNYLTADSDKKSKKRKRKNKDGGLVIDDDEALGWSTKADDDDDDAPMIGMLVSVGWCCCVGICTMFQFESSCIVVVTWHFTCDG